MTTADYDKCARRIVEALQLSAGEKVLIKRDRRVFAQLFPPLKNLIDASGANILAEILSEDSNDDLESLRRLFQNADVYMWLPELHQGNTPALGAALKQWL